MTTVTLEEAKMSLEDLIRRLTPGDSVVILREGHPVAKLSTVIENESAAPQGGFWKDSLRIVDESDSHLDDFREYMS